ncbi:MAG: rhomboid family intramembrane serine protease [Verrucomicrobiales bacterium]
MARPPALPTDHRRDQLVAAVKDNVTLLFGIAGLFWGLEILDQILFGFLDHFGIRPRTLPGLAGVFLAPFIHLGFGHLVSNTLPFLILGGVVLVGGRKIFVTASLFIVAVGGGMLWTLGPSSTNHIGASLLVFGYFGFLIARGVFERSAFWIVVSIITLILYGGMLAEVVPGQRGISWQGHLFGFVAGVLAARVMFTREMPARRVNP